MDFKTGGRKVIDRLIEAYGFTTRQALCDHLGVSKSTLATRYMRDLFPAEWVIQCVLETGVSLQWLANGQGAMIEGDQGDIQKIIRKKIIDGIIYDSNYYYLDKTTIAYDLINGIAIADNKSIYIAELNFSEVTDGKWLIDIDRKASIREITRLPKERIKVENGKHSFECSINDINFIGKIKTKITEID
ncbi:helix-turn-helix domain-containing protein [Serratia marcescens]|uniref:phage repressor protein CI n=2 Tax=Serratia marcescens TaxID=615 RepID=UPI001CDCA1DE|nr:phage repressor protein CI [Serratia marcescens]MCA3994700.1 phage repressor protein CI [Serratia marcescens]MDM1848903.1 helix-turn-helix domain-containing protein [Serratia marcescens]UMK49516.1 helix-turn-helix domain-containing protein [Serratia marcescens]